MRIYLPIITLLIFGLSFIWSSLRVYKQTGINPMRFGQEDNAHDYIGKAMKIIIALLFITVFIYAFNWNYAYLMPVWYLESPAFAFSGLILLHISLVWIVYAQLNMGKSWRIGLDTAHKTELITTGVFSLSRNPIFLGMLCCMMGIFLIIPNMLTFCILLVAYFVIQIQVRLEEEFLTTQHGSSYLSYKNKVRRWL